MTECVGTDYCADCVRTSCTHRGHPTNLDKGDSIRIKDWKWTCPEKLTMEDLKRASKTA